MNSSKSTHGSSETQEKQPPTNSFPIEILDLSVDQNQNKSWKRWLHCFTIYSQQNLNRALWRTHLVNFLESTWARIFWIFLIILDLVFTILEISYTTLNCHLKHNKTIGEWFHWAGVGILIILSAKSMALLVGLGFSFFMHLGHVLDGAVVIAALLLEVFLERKGANLMIIVSLWRVLRVVESAFELRNEDIKFQLEGIVSQFEELKEENRRLLEEIEERNKKIEKLQEELHGLQQASLG
ncbi:hypothetical protein L6164_012043 [Bauhinia variegata]|uniref:Uncharacterized protein n=1 Tax=Bauhinia variegata TaxID=167791 RepID=A0ACB9P917_BAUVA|nr:hypothetical protein L6164_012043 [Bauhinia variegata]